MPEIIELDKIIYILSKQMFQVVIEVVIVNRMITMEFINNNSIIQIIKTIHIFEIIQSIKKCGQVCLKYNFKY